MELAGHVFQKASAIDAMRESDGSVRTYTYADRDYANVYDPVSNPTGRRLHTYGRGPFTFLDLDQLPSTPAAYVIVRAVTILYVGMTKNLDQRWGHLGYEVISVFDCYVGGATTNCRINNLIMTELIAGNEIGLWAHETPTPDLVEKAVYNSRKPPWNAIAP